MESHHEPAMISGCLRGMGREVTCLVQAMNINLPGHDGLQFTTCMIQKAPVDLPDGGYWLTIGRKTNRVRKENGRWLT